jgi:hypothetical protein
MLTTLAITLAGTILGLGFGASLGLGMFIGFWGGAGYGFMMGATVPMALHHDAAPAAHRSQPVRRAMDDRPTR